VTGSGVLIVQGGSNTLSGSSLATLQLVSGKLTDDKTASFTSLVITGGELTGKGKVTVTSTQIGSGTISGISLQTTNLELNGYATLNGAVITLTGTGKVSGPAQFTLNGGAASFVISSTATFSQSSDFGLVPGADPNPPFVRNDGSWLSSAPANIVVNILGNGKFSFATGSQLAVTGVNFATNNLDIATTAKFLGVTGNINSLTGGGYVELNGKTFTITTASVANLTHLNGQTTVSTGNGINYLSVANGMFQTSRITVTTFNFSAGTVQGTGSSSITATRTYFTGDVPKFVTSINVISKYISWACGTSCQIVSNGGVVANPASSEFAASSSSIKKVAVRKPKAVGNALEIEGTEEDEEREQEYE